MQSRRDNITSRLQKFTWYVPKIILLYHRAVHCLLLVCLTDSEKPKFPWCKIQQLLLPLHCTNEWAYIFVGYTCWSSYWLLSHSLCLVIRHDSSYLNQVGISVFMVGFDARRERERETKIQKFEFKLRQHTLLAGACMYVRLVGKYLFWYFVLILQSTLLIYHFYNFIMFRWAVRLVHHFESVHSANNSLKSFVGLTLSYRFLKIYVCLSFYRASRNIAERKKNDNSTKSDQWDVDHCYCFSFTICM